MCIDYPCSATTDFSAAAFIAVTCIACSATVAMMASTLVSPDSGLPLTPVAVSRMTAAMLTGRQASLPHQQQST